MSSLRLQQVPRSRAKKHQPAVLLQPHRNPNTDYLAAPKNVKNKKGKGKGRRKDTQDKAALHTAPCKTEQHSIDTMPNVGAQAPMWMF